MILLGAVMLATGSTPYALNGVSSTPSSPIACFTGEDVSTIRLRIDEPGDAPRDEGFVDRANHPPTSTRDDYHGIVAVEVVDPGLATVPGAVVAFAVIPRPQNAATLLSGENPESYLAKRGARAVTGRDGVAEVRYRRCGTAVLLVGVRHRNLWVSQCLVPHTAERIQCRMVLAPARDIRVKVEDSAGSPASEVELWCGEPTAHDSGRATQRIETRRAVSDSTGVATVLHAQELGVRVTDGREDFIVSPRVPGWDAAVRIDRASGSAAPTTIRLPPTGSITVEATDLRGEKLPPGTMVRLIPSACPETQVVKAIDARGSTTIGRVVTGLLWKAIIDGAECEQVAATVGPRYANENVHLVLKAKGFPMLTGRALLDGLPLHGHRIGITGLPPGSISNTAITDCEGAFRVVLRPDSIGAALTTLRVWAETLPRNKSEIEWRGILSLRAQTYDLGEFRLVSDSLGRIEATVPALVSGTVVATADDLAMTELRLKGLGPQDEVSLRRDELTGEFAFMGRTAAPALWLVVENQTSRTVSPILVKPGQTGVRVSLVRKAMMRARIVLQSNDIAECLRLVLVREGTGTAEPAPRARLLSDVEMEAEWSVDPGVYRLQVFGNGTVHPVKSIDGITVSPHSEVVQITPVPLDASELRVIKITIPGGTANRIVAHYPQDGTPIRDELSERVAIVAPIELFVRADGYQDTIVRNVAADSVVVMAPGIPVCIAVRLDTASSGGTISGWIKLLDDPCSTIASFLTHCEFEKGDSHVLLPRPGRYELFLQYRSAAGRQCEVACEPNVLEVGKEGGACNVIGKVVRKP